MVNGLEVATDATTVYTELEQVPTFVNQYKDKLTPDQRKAMLNVYAVSRQVVLTLKHIGNGDDVASNVARLDQDIQSLQLAYQNAERLIKPSMTTLPVTMSSRLKAFDGAAKRLITKFDELTAQVDQGGDITMIVKQLLSVIRLARLVDNR